MCEGIGTWQRPTALAFVAQFEFMVAPCSLRLANASASSHSTSSLILDVTLSSLQGLEAHTHARLLVLPAQLLANALRMFYRSDHRVSSDYLDDVAARLQVRLPLPPPPPASPQDPPPSFCCTTALAVASTIPLGACGHSATARLLLALVPIAGFIHHL